MSEGQQEERRTVNGEIREFKYLEVVASDFR